MKKLIVVLAILALAVPASAADWSFSGDARMQTYSAEFSKELSGLGRADTDTVWAKSDVLSRFTATVKSGDVMGYIQLRPLVANPFRHWFGEWDFGSGKLLVGKTWAVNTYFTNNQNFNENYYGAFGNLNDIRARVDQIQLKFGGLQIGFLTPYTGRGNGLNTLASDTTVGRVDADVTIPLIEAGYTFKMDTMSFKINAGYQTYDADYAAVGAASDDTHSIDSYLIGGAWMANFGAFYANVEAHYGQNMGNMGQNIFTDQYADFDANGKVADNTGYAYNLTLGFKINDMFTIEGGYGYIYGEDDVAGWTSDQKEDDATAYYVQFPITLAEGVYLIPEVGKFDFGDRDLQDGNGKVDQGDVTYWGANWKIAF
jgi:hypothetical protein